MSDGNISSTSNSTSTSLLDRVKASDPDAWRRLAKLYGPLVYRWARQVGLQDTDAADVGQEVSRTVAARIGTFRRDGPGHSFRAWLKTITRNKLGDHLRRRASQLPGPGGSDAYQRLQLLADASPEDGSSANSLETDGGVLRRALDLFRSDFEDATWQAFWRMTVDGHSASEVASDLGMTAHAVRQAKYRVLRRLRREMDGGLE